MKTFRPFLFCLLLLFPLAVFSQWTWRNPLPQGNSLTASWFLDPNLGYCVGYNRTVMKTTDGGNTWTTSLPGTMDPSHPLAGVCFPDPYTGFIINSWQDVYKTGDGGASWDLVHTEPGYYLNGVFFTDNLHGFVVCSDGRILRTQDGGLTWSLQDITSAGDLNAVWFPDAQTGYAVGDDGVVLRSSDGGISWLLQNSGTTNILNSVNFISSTSGYAVGYYGTVLSTVNGGTTWTLTNLGDQSWLYSVNMLNQDTALLFKFDYSSGGTGPNEYDIMRTADGGNTWNKTIVSNYTHTLFALNNGTAYIAGSLGFIARSDDWGANWTELTSCLTPNSISCIDFPSPDIGYGVTTWYEWDEGDILKTIDGGSTWSRLPSPIPYPFNTVNFASPANGCIGGYYIYGTFDGGNSWTLRYSMFYDRQVRSICFSNLTNGIAACDSGIILRTTDVGQSWTRVVSPTTNGLRSVCFPDENTGYIGGHKVFLKTQDGGATWVLKSLQEEIYGVYFTSSLKGFAVGDCNIFKTTNGGDSWTQYPVNTSLKPLYSVHFYDADTGFAVGGKDPAQNFVLKTVDGGMSWQATELPSQWSFYTIFATGNYNVYAGGVGGFLFSTSNGGLTGIKELSVPSKMYGLTSFPNPSSGPVTIRYTLERNSEVQIRFFNANGVPVQNPVTFRQDAGCHTFPFPSAGLKPGLYFYNLRANDHTETGKVFLLEGS